MKGGSHQYSVFCPCPCDPGLPIYSMCGRLTIGTRIYSSVRSPTTSVLERSRPPSLYPCHSSHPDTVVTVESWGSKRSQGPRPPETVFLSTF